jgi:hypothetical protein
VAMTIVTRHESMHKTLHELVNHPQGMAIVYSIQRLPLVFPSLHDWIGTSFSWSVHLNIVVGHGTKHLMGKVCSTRRSRRLSAIFFDFQCAQEEILLPGNNNTWNHNSFTPSWGMARQIIPWWDKWSGRRKNMGN